MLCSTIRPWSLRSSGTSTSPARLSDVVAEVSLATPEQLVEAFRAAKAAQPAWGATPAPVRGQVIAKIGRLVEANAEALAQLVTREVGKPIAEARGEVQEIVDTCDFFLGEGRRLYGQTVPSEMRDKQLFTFRVPVGVAGIITAGNFPVAVPSWYLVPALLCGNALVWKPAEYAAALGDASKVRFVATSTQNRFTALQSGEIDVLLRNTGWSLTREGNLGLAFASVNFCAHSGLEAMKTGSAFTKPQPASMAAWA